MKDLSQGWKPITISLNPTYLCNFRCKFCYLTPKQLADKQKLELNRLDQMLQEIKDEGFYLDHIDLYGGEVGILEEEYLNKIHSLISKHGTPTISVNTNLFKVNPYFLRDDVTISVSYDFEARERHKEVLNNILMLNKPVVILLLASPELVKIDVDYMIRVLNRLTNVHTVEVKPYSSNQSNNLSLTDRDFEEFIKKWIQSPIKKEFKFTNAQRISRSLSKEYSAYSDNHIYITPTGKFAVLDFDSNDREYFLEMNRFVEYLDWADLEKKKVNNNPICNQCTYLGHCLTEHYRDVKSLENSCSGFQGLLDWSKEHRSLIEQMAQ